MAIKGNGTQVILGAGKWYLDTWSSGAIALSTLCVESNIIGWTQSGATLEYKPETYTIEDDIGMVKRTFQTKATATLKTGLLTFDVDALAKVLSSVDTSDITDVAATSSAAGSQTMKLSGGRKSLVKYAVAFEYEDPETEHKVRIGMIATNIAGLSMAFAKDKETVVDVEFQAESNGVDDTIMVIEEVIPATGT